MNQGKKTVQPHYLKAGDKVALVSPAYWVPQEAILQAAETIISWGLQPVLGPHTNNLNVNAYAGTADERAADLMWALEDDSIKAIVCSRGGYGTIHLLNASQTHKGNVQFDVTGHFLGMTQMSAYLNLQIPFFFIIFAPNQLPS
jgi:muramoyltetrapeptide carboxypeptidase LdcA involved in peptidoglycan recycling